MISAIRRKILPLFFLMTACQTQAQVTLHAGELELQIDGSGMIGSIRNTRTRQEYLYRDTLHPLLTLVSGNKHYLPGSMKARSGGKVITLFYPETKVTIELAIQSLPHYLKCTVVKAEPAARADALIWGPIPTTIRDTVGEVIGVVRDQQAALGMFMLNVKTMGGDLPNSEGSSWSRGIAAKPQSWGSSLQAYSTDRSKPRNVDAWGGVFKNMPVPVMKGETVVGSSVALFSCSNANVLDILERITLDEKLPHPTYKGVWLKRSELFGKSYLISSFGEKEVDEMIGYTKRAGLISLYHEGPFQSWGHYILDSTAFPHGVKGLKECADKAHAAGILFGVHTLTNFINTNDPYITPVPDERLSLTGSSVLMKDIDATATTIEVASPEYFDQEENNNLHTVKIGKELVRYRTVTATAPFLLLDCQRGAFGTTAAAHTKNASVGKLMDHAYQVFFPNLELQREIAGNIARLFNAAGVDHFDLDGHEGCLSSGQGDYALELFAQDVYRQMDHEFICGTSNSKTFFWNIGAYYNWGEPWYGGFNESMQQYRIDNQGLFNRNYMPHMLGWYLLAEKTTLPEMEWMLARAAGYNAGFAMVARPQALRTNPISGQLLDAIREWETARNGHAFSAAQQALLKDPKQEFHLQKTAEGKWTLSHFGAAEFLREKKERQPGEPVFSTFSYEQPYAAEPLQFMIRVNGTAGSISKIRIQADHYNELVIPVELKAGQRLVCDGTADLRIFDEKGKAAGVYHLPAAPVVMPAGKHNLVFDCAFSDGEAPTASLQVKYTATKEEVQVRK